MSYRFVDSFRAAAGSGWNCHSILILLKILHTYLPMKMEQTVCSETSAYKIQTPGNYPEENIQHPGASLEGLRKVTNSLIQDTDRDTNN
jgi:hypothetical protein